MKSVLILFVALSFIMTGSAIDSELGYSSPKDENENESQIGIYVGYVFVQTVSDASGKHGSFFGQDYRARVKDIEIDQNFAAGINIIYYVNNFFGFDIDFMYSQASFPEQTVSLNSYTLLQPKSDLILYTISFGPIFRYKGVNLWQKMNPYASISLSAPFGSASDVNLSPYYGQGGSSPLEGLGFNIQIGTQYKVSNFAFNLEYRFEYLDMTVDHFRSFTQGLNFTKSGSYILIGGFYNF